MGFELKVYVEPKDATHCGRCWCIVDSLREYRSPSCDIFGPLQDDSDRKALRHPNCIESEEASKVDQ